MIDLSVGAFKALTGGNLDPPGTFNIDWSVFPSSDCFVVGMGANCSGIGTSAMLTGNVNGVC